MKSILLTVLLISTTSCAPFSNIDDRIHNQQIIDYKSLNIENYIEGEDMCWEWIEGVTINPVQINIYSPNYHHHIGSHYGYVGHHYRTHKYHHTNTYCKDPVPEPATMLLFGTGIVGFSCLGKRIKK